MGLCGFLTAEPGQLSFKELRNSSSKMPNNKDNRNTLIDVVFFSFRVLKLSQVCVVQTSKDF